MRFVFFLIGILAGFEVMVSAACGADQAAQIQTLQGKVAEQAQRIKALESLGVSTTLPFRAMVGLYEIQGPEKSSWDGISGIATNGMITSACGAKRGSMRWCGTAGMNFRPGIPPMSCFACRNSPKRVNCRKRTMKNTLPRCSG